MTITTRYVYPPIPTRAFDWCAYYDELDEETRDYGWGTTEQAAIADLKEMYYGPASPIVETEECFIILRADGLHLGTHIFTSRAHAMKWVEDKGFTYNGLEIVPATLTYETGKGRDK